MKYPAVLLGGMADIRRVLVDRYSALVPESDTQFDVRPRNGYLAKYNDRIFNLVSGRDRISITLLSFTNG